MKLIVNIKLMPTQDQHKTLSNTLAVCNDACNEVSKTAFTSKTFGQYNLHKLVYFDIKKKFNLSAQVVVRSIAKVADSYKTSCKSQHHFRKDSAQPYDDRIIRFTKDDIVSIWTIDGRQKIPFAMGDHQRQLFAHRKGEVDLMKVKNKFYLACVCDIDDPEIIKTKDVIGVDMGIVNIATSSNGQNYSGDKLNNNRAKYAHRRKNLQKKKTRSAKRKLKKISGKQARFQKDINHCISKDIVQNAQRTSSVIALENLRGIRKRVTARKRQRARLSNWGFNQLQNFIAYKAKRAGIPVVFVDPRNTSRECPRCGHTNAANRKVRDSFICIKCDFAGPSDAVAALNIRARALVNEPMVTSMHNFMSPQLQAAML